MGGRVVVVVVVVVFFFFTPSTFVCIIISLEKIISIY